MQNRCFLSVLAAVALASGAGDALAQEDTFKIGLIVPLSGPSWLVFSGFSFHS